MKNDRFYQALVSKMHEVVVVPPQRIGPFTFIYKSVVPYFKFHPWISVGIFSTILSFFLYLLLGPTLVKFASLLQLGF